MLPRTICSRKKALNDRLRQLLEELSDKLCEAIAESPEVREKLDQIHSSGYSLYLLLDCKKHSPRERNDLRSGMGLESFGEPGDLEEPGTLRESRPGEDGGSTVDAKGVELSVRSRKQLPAAPPGIFRIDAGDLAFLKSVGIDPTRRLKKSPGRNRRESEKESSRTSKAPHDSFD